MEFKDKARSGPDGYAFDAVLGLLLAIAIAVVGGVIFGALQRMLPSFVILMGAVLAIPACASAATAYVKRQHPRASLASLLAYFLTVCTLLVGGSFLVAGLRGRIEF